MDSLILSSGDFQCPDSGQGCVIFWNTINELLWAEPCDTGIWSDQKVSQDTLDWCDKFGVKWSDNAIRSNEILSNYGLYEYGFDESFEVEGN